MRTAGAVRYKLKQVLYRHKQRLVREYTKEVPENCKFHRLVEVGLGVEVEMCLYGADDPTTWQNRDCTPECEFFKPKIPKEEVKAQFKKEIEEGEVADIAVKYPDAAALMWVLEGELEEPEMSLSPLLDVFPFTSQDIKKGVIPLAMEFPVEQKLAPYLVSSSKGVVWVKKASKQSFVRAAVRNLGDKGIGEFFREIVLQVREMSLEAEWGSAHPFNKEGIASAISYIESHGFDEVDVLIHPETKEDPEMLPVPCPGMSAKTQIVEADWMLPRAVVVVPHNREYLGFAGMLSNNTLISVVHNPSRGMGIAIYE